MADPVNGVVWGSPAVGRPLYNVTGLTTPKCGTRCSNACRLDPIGDHSHVRQAPFRRFVLSMENGDHVRIDRPENIAFDPDGNSVDFYVISGQVRLFGTFEAVTNVATADSVEYLS
jgi:hypothetical protein